jgi:hypothetical protein
MLVQTERIIPDWFNRPQRQLTASYWKEGDTTFALLDPNNGFYPSVPLAMKRIPYTRVYDLNPGNPGDFGVVDFSDYGFKLIHQGLNFKRLRA